MQVPCTARPVIDCTTLQSRPSHSLSEHDDSRMWAIGKSVNASAEVVLIDGPGDMYSLFRNSYSVQAAARTTRHPVHTSCQSPTLANKGICWPRMLCTQGFCALTHPKLRWPSPSNSDTDIDIGMWMPLIGAQLALFLYLCSWPALRAAINSVWLLWARSATLLGPLLILPGIMGALRRSSRRC